MRAGFYEIPMIPSIVKFKKHGTCIGTLRIKFCKELVALRRAEVRPELLEVKKVIIICQSHKIIVFEPRSKQLAGFSEYRI